jgi:hypothetical protein
MYNHLFSTPIQYYAFVRLITFFSLSKLTKYGLKHNRGGKEGREEGGPT